VDGQAEGGTRNAQGDKLFAVHLHCRLGDGHRVGGRALRGSAKHLFAAVVWDDRTFLLHPLPDRGRSAKNSTMHPRR